MAPDTQGISVDTSEDRYTRLRMIPWWDQELLARSKVLVVGAGALGNEVIKNLALLGIGTIAIVDFDVVETSNLSRSVLYTVSDEGTPKAEAAARAAKSLNPDCTVHAINADVTRQLGAGVFRWADIVICGLDNREARLAVNRACWKVSRPWVDGATESFQGVARVFTPPDGVCYECTLGEQDHRIMEVRDSCGFLAREAYRQGRTPTTPTTAAVIAGVQVQEAIKLLHRADLPNLAGKGFFFDGSNYDCFTIEYQRRDDCMSHETYDRIVHFDLDSTTATIDDVLATAAGHLHTDTVMLDLPDELVTSLRCSHCGHNEQFFKLLPAVEPDEARCVQCSTMRVPETVAQVRAGSEFGNRTLENLGFGAMEIIQARAGESAVQIEVSGDAGRLFGEPL